MRAELALFAVIAAAGHAQAQIVYFQDSRAVEASAEVTNPALPDGEQTQRTKDGRQPTAQFASPWDEQVALSAGRDPGSAFARAAQLSRLEPSTMFAWGDAGASVTTGGGPGVLASAHGVSRFTIGFSLLEPAAYTLDVSLLSSGGSSAEMLLIGSQGLIEGRYSTGDDSVGEVIAGVLEAGQYQLSISAGALVAVGGLNPPGSAAGASSYTVTFTIPAPASGAMALGLVVAARRRR